MPGPLRVILPLGAAALGACVAPAPRLVSFSPAPAEPGCVRVETGFDLDHNGRLDANEVLESELVCDQQPDAGFELALDGGATPAPSLEVDPPAVCTEGHRARDGSPGPLAARAQRRPRPPPRRSPGARRRVQRRWLATVLRRVMALVVPDGGAPGPSSLQRR